MRDAGKGMTLAVTSALWAAAFLIPYKAAGEIAPRSSVVLAMLLCAAVLGTASTAWTARGRLGVNRISLAVAVVLGALSVVGNVAMAEALARVEPALTSVILQTEILFVAVIAAAWLREAITLRFAIGGGLALVGFAIMRAPDSESMAIDAAGAAFACLAALSFAVMHVVTRSTIRRIRPHAVNALRLWLAVLCLALLPGRAAGLGALGIEAWVLAAAAAFCGPFLGRLCLMYSARYIPAGHAKLASLVSPLFAFALGLVAFGSMPSTPELVGGAVILLGVAIPLFEHARASSGAAATRPRSRTRRR